MYRFTQLILKIGAEGGSIALYGNKEINGWKFALETNESALVDMLDENDRQGVSYTGEPPWIHTWDVAFDQLDRYSWQNLRPIEVHPDFRQTVWKEILRRINSCRSSHRVNDWLRMCYPYRNEVAKLSLCIKQSRSTVILTGAGMSTESGIPDFRSKDGWWQQIDPKKVASREALEHSYLLFHEFYSVRMMNLKKCSPHKGHYILADWEKRGLLQAVATQNVDGFHQEVGSNSVFELHGTIRSVRCQVCGSLGDAEEFINGETCGICNGKLRPNVVLFGETLPERAWENALDAIQKADLVIVIGTSLEVYPVIKLPAMTKGKVGIINLEPTAQDDFFDMVVYGKAGEVLEEIDRLL